MSISPRYNYAFLALDLEFLKILRERKFKQIFFSNSSKRENIEEEKMPSESGEIHFSLKMNNCLAFLVSETAISSINMSEPRRLQNL